MDAEAAQRLIPSGGSPKVITNPQKKGICVEVANDCAGGFLTKTGGINTYLSQVVRALRSVWEAAVGCSVSSEAVDSARPPRDLWATHFLESLRF